jgi:hypothetical protein
MSGKPKSLLGNVYGKLTVVKLSDKRYQRKAIWECLCECGKTTEVATGSLVSGNTTSCGCYRDVIRKTFNKSAIVQVAPVIPVTATDAFYSDIIKLYPNLTFTLKNMKFGLSALLEENSKLAITFVELSKFHQEILVSSGKCKTYAEAKKVIISNMEELVNDGNRVLTVFENEWESKRSKMINFLSSALKQNKITVFARKCTVKAITKQEANEFLKEEHIQGPANLSYLFYGLYDVNNVLIEVVSFGRHHRAQSIWNSPTTTVLDRLAIKSNYNIPGGSSKVLAFAEKDLKSKGYNTVVSWADRRISQGNLYNVLNFELYATLQSDYSYWCSVESAKEGKCIVRGKQSNKKCNLHGILPTQTELDYTRDVLFQFRVFDCGKLVYVKYI